MWLLDCVSTSETMSQLAKTISYYFCTISVWLALIILLMLVIVIALHDLC